MDRQGYSAWPSIVTNPVRKNLMARNQNHIQPCLVGFPIGEMPDRALRDLVVRCVQDGVAIAGLRMPESPTYRSWYTDKGRAVADAYQRKLVEEVGIPMFPSPDGLLTDEDFA